MPHTNLGSLYGSLGSTESAIKEFKIATTLNPGDEGAWLNLFNSYKDVGLHDKAAEAYKKFEELTRAKPAAVSNVSNIPGGAVHRSDQTPS